MRKFSKVIIIWIVISIPILMILLFTPEFYSPYPVFTVLYDIFSFFITFSAVFGGVFIFSFLCSRFGDIDDNSNSIQHNSRHISQTVRASVWRRDGGQCIQCGSRERLEFDHIIPFSKGGSNTERNIQLLCEKCNRQKSNSI